jgi:hypothetical protein
MAKRGPAEASGQALAKASTSAKVVMAPASGILQAFATLTRSGVCISDQVTRMSARTIGGAARVTKEQQRHVAPQ